MPARRASPTKRPFELRLLGGATLLDPDQRPVRGRAVHRHRLALLAVLGRAHPGGVSRDRLIGLLWPERDTAGARHLLRQAIHDIRQELGPAVIGSIGDDVWLGESRVAVDVLAFEAAIGAGDLEEAATSYRGPFLDGFFLDDAQEFDEWMEAQRSQLAGRYQSALESLRKVAESRDDHSIAARWWRVLAAARPSDSRVALRLIDALDAMRDRDAALAVGAQHVAYLRSEIGVEPEVTFTARLAQLGVAPSRYVSAPAQAAEQLTAVAPLRDTTLTADGPARPGPDGALHQRRAADVLSAGRLPASQQQAGEASEPVGRRVRRRRRTPRPCTRSSAGHAPRSRARRQR